MYALRTAPQMSGNPTYKYSSRTSAALPDCSSTPTSHLPMALVTPFSKVTPARLELRRSLAPPRRGVAVRAAGKAFTLPDLSYDYGALEPYISGEIMQIHHQKHHQAYVNNYNSALEQLHDAIGKGDSAKIVGLQGAIKFNGGGHVNHTIFWQNLAPTSAGGGDPPQKRLWEAIQKEFGSMETLIKKMNTDGASVQGSGWVWLAFDKELKKLKVETTPNQDLLVTKGANLVPLLGIDVWEHAYYLQYKNVRPDYLNNIWNVMNWTYASKVYDETTQ